MTVAPRVPAGEGGEIHISRLPATIHADLGPAARVAFGRWVRSVYGLVEHLEHCPFGCTAERTVCSDGDDAVDDELAEWQSWREAR